jgi:TolB-like protein
MEDSREIRAVADGGGERLEGWKAIAAHFGRDIRTVQRWERSERLPVRRHGHDRQASAYAYVNELDTWRLSRTPESESEPSAPPSFDTGMVNESNASLRASGRAPGTWIVLTVVALMAAGTATAAWRVLASKKSPTNRDRLHSLAVLPLRNLTGDSGQDYFVDGLTEQIRSEIARTKSFDVVSGASGQRFKQGSVSAPEIARQLGRVDGLLEGGVTRSGNRVRVTLDILTLYGEISRAVAAEVEVDLARATSLQAAPRQAVRPEAYDRFLQARYFSHGWQSGGCIKAVPVLLEAISLDPSFADPYVELGYCNVYPAMLRQTSTQAAKAAHAAIARALELDGSSGLAYAVLGQIQYGQDFDWVAAERSFRTGLEIKGNDPLTSFLYGQMLVFSGRQDEGLALLREGFRRDPLSMDMKTAYGASLRVAGRLAEAVECFKDVLTHAPDWAGARFFLSASYSDLGREREAVSEYLSFLHAVLPAARADAAAARLESTFVRSGWSEFLKQDVDLASDPNGTFVSSVTPPFERFWSPYWMAVRYARVGDTDHAVKQLEAAVNSGDHSVLMMDVDPALDGLRSDSRFQDLRRRVGVPSQPTVTERPPKGQPR